eukprot:12896959-Prorocentrum_lima.AAC.1
MNVHCCVNRVSGWKVNHYTPLEHVLLAISEGHHGVAGFHSNHTPRSQAAPSNGNIALKEGLLRVQPRSNTT